MSLLGVRGLGVLSLTLGAGALIGFAGGCFITNKAHCGFHDSGISNPCPSGFVCNVCEVDNNGCVPESQSASIPVQCRDASWTTTTGPQTESETETTVTTEPMPPTSTVTEPTTTTDPTDTTDTTITTTDASTTVAPSTTMMADCDPDIDLVDADCGEQYCVGLDQCGWCNSLPAPKTCADVDPLTPACDSGSGKCVECTPEDASLCTGATPACDPDSLTCVPCTEHSQCPNSACDIHEGVCFPEEPEAIFYVKGGLSDCPAKDGKTESSALCQLADVQLTNTKTTIRLLTSSVSPGALAVPDGKIVAVVKYGSSTPEINGTGTGVTFDVNGAGARLYLAGIKLRNAESAVVRCASGSFYAHDLYWDGNNINTARAIEGTLGCNVFVHRSRIVRCNSGIQMTSGQLRVENSFIMDNGAAGVGFSAFHFVNDVKAQITYSTIGRNRLIGGVSTFACTGNNQEVVVRNSAIVGQAAVVEDPDCVGKVEFQHGVMEEGPNSSAVDAVLQQWFGNPQLDVYTPKNGDMVDPLEDKAMWEPGDPRYDFTGMAKIPTDKPSFAGAKQPL